LKKLSNNLNIQLNHNFSCYLTSVLLGRKQGLCRPSKYVITVVSNNDEFMLGITCEKHKTSVFSKIKSLQSDGKIPNGTIKFENLKSVQTDCIRGDPDDLIQL